MSYKTQLNKWAGELKLVVSKIQKAKFPGGAELGDVSEFCDYMKQIAVEVNQVRSEIEAEADKYEDALDE